MTALAVAFALSLAAALLAAGLWLRQRAVSHDLRRRLQQATPTDSSNDRARDTFLDLVTHELRSPLSAIIGYQELMTDGVYGPIDAAASEPLARIGRSAQLLLHLLDGIMDLARIRTAALEPSLETVDLVPLAEAAAREFQAYAHERQLQTSVHIDRDLPTIRSDPERLARALHLLIVAAVKSADDLLELHVDADPGGATVRIRGTRLVVRNDFHDLPPDTGVRVAVVAATAALLGGDLRSEDGDNSVTPQVVFVIRDVDRGLPPQAGPPGPAAVL